jgi:hypothetical protein
MKEPTERDNSEDVGVDGKILQWILGKYDVKFWTECIWFTQKPLASCCEQGNKLSGSIKGGKAHTQENVKFTHARPSFSSGHSFWIHSEDVSTSALSHVVLIFVSLVK